MDREMLYACIYEEVSLYQNSNESEIYTKNQMELLIRVSALTDAALYDRISLSEAKHLLREYIATLKTTAPVPEPEAKDGAITF